MAHRVIVRQAELQDRRALWEWRNDPFVRSVIYRKPSIDWDTHCSWFAKIQEDPDRILCIGAADTVRIGTVRFDRRDVDQYEVSLFLKPAYCGRGYIASLLEESVAYLTRVRKPRRVFAAVTVINSFSKAVFQDAGFVVVEETESSFRCEMAFQGNGESTATAPKSVGRT